MDRSPSLPAVSSNPPRGLPAHRWARRRVAASKNQKPNPEGGGCWRHGPRDAPTSDKGPPTRSSRNPHICRGINTCKNKGKDRNEQRVAPAGPLRHRCGARLQTGQDRTIARGPRWVRRAPRRGTNARARGACEVPLSDKTLAEGSQKSSRRVMKRGRGKKFGAAPAKKD